MKNHESINECSTIEINNQFVISDTVIYQIEASSIQIYYVSSVCQDSVSKTYSTQKGDSFYSIVKLKGLPIIGVYYQYESVSLGSMVMRETYINRNKFDEESKRE